MRHTKFSALLAGLASLILLTPPAGADTFAVTASGAAVAAPSPAADAPDTAAVPAPPRPTDRTAAPSDPAALGGYNVLIADRGNNRLLLVSPEKQILWEYHFHGLAPGDGADDAFFADNGQHIMASVEHGQIVEVIDRATKKVTWRYGHINHKGWSHGRLDFPDDAYRLPNGDVIVADIRNCRILEVAPDKHIVRQAGVTQRCRGVDGALASPNGDKPLPNGHILVSTIQDHSLIELDSNWKPILHLTLPIRYPSDPQPTMAGNIVVAGYTNPGRIIILDRTGKVLWDYKGRGPNALDRPSLAIELPNGNIMATDDLHARVVVIDRASQKIVWQYGVNGHAGSAPGYLRIPDGLDIEKVVQSAQN